MGLRSFGAKCFGLRTKAQKTSIQKCGVIGCGEELETRQLLSVTNRLAQEVAQAQFSPRAVPVLQNLPFVLSIVPVVSGPVTSSTWDFTVTFNKPVTGVTARTVPDAQ